MVCRCSSAAEHEARYRANNAIAAQHEEKRLQEVIKKLQRELGALTPNPEAWSIVAAERVGPHLVLRVAFPACEHAGYGGDKVLVYLYVTELQALRWRRLDPHFRETSSDDPADAPPPAARFPASETGWTDALGYARDKYRQHREKEEQARREARSPNE